MLIFTSKAQPTFDIDYLRANYDKAITDKKLCNTVILDLQKRENSPLTKAYLGGFQTIWANHAFSPITKLKTFKKGKNNIENAVSSDPYNPEIRYIRLSVQKNAPSFLGYNSKIKEDESFLKLHRDKITSDVVQKKINKILEL